MLHGLQMCRTLMTGLSKLQRGCNTHTSDTHHLGLFMQELLQNMSGASEAAKGIAKVLISSDHTDRLTTTNLLSHLACGV